MSHGAVHLLTKAKKTATNTSPSGEKPSWPGLLAYDYFSGGPSGTLYDDRVEMELTDRDPLTHPSPPLAGERRKVRGLL